MIHSTHAHSWHLTFDSLKSWYLKALVLLFFFPCKELTGTIVLDIIFRSLTFLSQAHLLLSNSGQFFPTKKLKIFFLTFCLWLLTSGSSVAPACWAFQRATIQVSQGLKMLTELTWISFQMHIFLHTFNKSGYFSSRDQNLKILRQNYILFLGEILTLTFDFPLLAWAWPLKVRGG